ncbi:hypothetical protein [Sphingobium cupriresistens]|uniref:Uncharacterized protein n=1 Tax=Sphingobium cupriresistens TaxID=1132417 RepID=A0A8G1ZF40_9SPHN|nr:hypothetical protein [Sphingobium cupriresistens]RYM07983.1 hypothetical protein EWH12_17770 [Sphingobium cupriresistens]
MNYYRHPELILVAIALMLLVGIVRDQARRNRSPRGGAASIPILLTCVAALLIGALAIYLVGG